MAALKPQCIHRWQLESPQGLTVEGVCAHCGRRRAFPAQTPWREITPEQRAQRRAIRRQSEELETTNATLRQ
jgi:hypothetical protein